MVYFSLQCLRGFHVLIVPTLLILTGHQGEAVHPCIIWPGYGGNRILASVDNKTSKQNVFCSNKGSNWTIWADPATVLQISTLSEGPLGKCWVENMKLHYDNVTRKTSNTPGVNLTVEFGKVDAVEKLYSNKTGSGLLGKILPNVLQALEIFKYMVDGFVKCGHVRDVTVIGAPVDFRKAPNELQDHFAKYKALIEETCRKNGYTAVVLIGHSMGCALVLYFLQQQSQDWKDKYIKAFICLNGNFCGCLLPVQVCSEGNTFNIPLASKVTLRKVLTTCPSLMYQFPRRKCWKDDEVIVSTRDKNYSLGNMGDFFYDLNKREAYEMYEDVKDFKVDMSAPGVECHILQGYGLDTLKTIRYSGSLLDHKATTHGYGDGDGTVLRKCLQVCRDWISTQPQKVYIEELEGVSHGGITKEKDVVDYVCKVTNS